MKEILPSSHAFAARVRVLKKRAAYSQRSILTAVMILFSLAEGIVMECVSS